MSRSSPTPPKGLIRAFFGLWTLASLAFLVFGVGLPSWRIHRASTWEEVPCTVLESRVESRRSSESTSYLVVARFEYEVDGVRHESDRYNISRVHAGRAASEDAVAAIPAGTRTVCYVDPADPTRAVLVRGWTQEWIFGLVAALFLAIGVAGFVVVPRRIDRRAALVEEVGLDAHGSADTFGTVSSASTFAMRDGARGPIDLARGTRRRSVLVGLGVFTVLWNSVTWTFLVARVFGEQEELSVLLWIVAVLFPLVGALVALAFLYHLVGLLGPGVDVSLGDAHLEPGAETDLSWRLDGGAGGVRRLEGRLELREVRLTGGDDVSLSSRTVRVEPVFDTNRRSTFERGRAQLVVPPDAPPSKEGEDAARRWVLVIEGHVPLRPNVREEFVLWVHPATDSEAS